MSEVIAKVKTEINGRWFHAELTETHIGVYERGGNVVTSRFDTVIDDMKTENRLEEEIERLRGLLKEALEVAGCYEEVRVLGKFVAREFLARPEVKELIGNNA